jgi:hypothetical protein
LGLTPGKAVVSKIRTMTRSRKLSWRRYAYPSAYSPYSV